MTDRETFYALRERYDALCLKEQEYRSSVLWDKYRSFRPNTSWLTRTETARLESFRRQQDKVGEKFFALLDRIGGRNFRSYCPYHWALEKLTFEDAITTGPMSAIPPSPYGYADREVADWADSITEGKAA